MDVYSAGTLAERLMADWGLAGWQFGFNRRKRSLGICRYAERRIELSVHFVIANGQEAVRETVLHEIAHALAGARAGHGPRWKAMCARVGAKPERCDTEAQMPQGAWRARCGGCGREYTRHRRPLKGWKYACRSCGPATGVVVFRRDGRLKIG